MNTFEHKQMSEMDELRSNIEAAAELIEAFNPENITEVEPGELNEFLEDNEGLNSLYGDIASELIENKISLYYTTLGDNYGPESLRGYSECMEDWAENEFDLLKNMAKDDPESYGKIFFDSIMELTYNEKYSYDEEEYEISTRFEGDMGWHIVNITMYSFGNLEDINILEISGGELSYRLLDEEDAEKLLETFKNAYDTDKPENIIKALDKEKLTYVELAADEYSF